MRSSALFALSLALLLAVPCFAQRQLAFPTNPERMGFPPGHPGVPIIVDVSAGKTSAWGASPGSGLVFGVRRGCGVANKRIA